MAAHHPKLWKRFADGGVVPQVRFPLRHPDIPNPQGGVHSFSTSSQGLVLGHTPHKGLIISNPLSPTAAWRYVPCDFGWQQPQLLVEDAAKGVYKVSLATSNATHIFDSVTGGWRIFPTPEEILSQGNPPRACLFASRATRDHRPFTSPSSYLLQVLKDNESLRSAQPLEWRHCDEGVPGSELRGYPSDVEHPFMFHVLHAAATKRCIGVVLKRHYPADRSFVEVVVYELVEGDETLIWKSMGRAELLRDADWAVYADVYTMGNIACLCSENLLVLQLRRPFSTDLEKYSARECRGMQPVVFDLEDRMWTFFDHVDDGLDRCVSYIFKPDPAASPGTCTATTW